MTMWIDDWNRDEPWDEEQWEAFLRANDRHMDRCLMQLHDFLRRHPRPQGEDAERLAGWKAQLRAFIDRNGWTRHDLVLPFLWLDAPAPDAFGEADASSSAEQALAHLPVYHRATRLTRRVLDWSDDVPGGAKDSTLVQFCAAVLRVPAQVLEGHAIGAERARLAGNIACVKRALAAANEALALLRQLKDEPYLQPTTYRALYEETYELRNTLGIYVQELRERLNLGID